MTMIIDRRPMIDFIHSLNRKGLVGVEVGVAQGTNAKNILHKLDMERLYLVDNYLEHKEHYSIASRKLARYYSKTVFLVSDSDKASRLIPEQVDFIYIDGDHSYYGVTKDIFMYYPLVKKGGVFGGHDFYGNFPGVVTAVLDWTQKNGLKLFTENFDWWVIK